MKIIHFCLSCFYIDGHSYQENILVREHVKLGHDVKVIASTETFNEKRQLDYLEPGTYMGTDGAEVTRLAYASWLPHSVMTKLRIHNGVYQLLENEAPDIIMFHGFCGWELLTVAKYKKNNPDVILNVDSHEDHYNSGRSFVSKNILHGLYYKFVARKAIKHLTKVLCISLDTIEFLHTLYKVPRGKLEFFPLGANIFSDAEFEQRRQHGREQLGLNENHIMLLQSGKQTEQKKLIETLENFQTTTSVNLRLYIAGSLSESIKEQAEALINNDERIIFLGWQDAKQLGDLLCSADVYVQPGTQSATMQMSLGARCAILLDNVLSHEPFYDNNGWLINDEAEMKDIFKQIEQSAMDLSGMGERSYKVASELLDYKVLAERILEER